jgi:hypothetical protein
MQAEVRASRAQNLSRRGANGACGLLFCAAERSGAFSPNIPAGLRARVSRLGGFSEYLEGCAMLFLKSQPVEIGHGFLSSATAGPLKI